jgi:hypothetical protein
MHVTLRGTLCGWAGSCAFEEAREKQGHRRKVLQNLLQLETTVANTDVYTRRTGEGQKTGYRKKDWMK